MQGFSASWPRFLRHLNVLDIAHKKFYLLDFYSSEAQITNEILEPICVLVYELLKSFCFSLLLYVYLQSVHYFHTFCFGNY